MLLQVATVLQEQHLRRLLVLQVSLSVLLASFISGRRERMWDGVAHHRPFDHLPQDDDLLSIALSQAITVQQEPLRLNVLQVSKI